MLPAGRLLSQRATSGLRAAPGLARPRLSSTQCRVARPSAVLDNPVEVVEAPRGAAAAQDAAADSPPPPRRRRQPRGGRRSSYSADDSDDDQQPSQQQHAEHGPSFTPVESASSLILRGLLTDAQADDNDDDPSSSPSVPLAVESADGLAVAVLALSRAQHALRTERGLELSISSASTRRTGGGGSGGGGGGGGKASGGPTRTSLRAVLRAGPCAPPTDRPVRRIDVVPGTARNAVVAAAVEALRAGAAPGQPAAAAAPVDLVARGPSAASNALAALGLIRAAMLSGAAAFTPGKPPAWVGGGAARRQQRQAEEGTEEQHPQQQQQEKPADDGPAFPSLDVVAVLDALPPARPSSATATLDAAAQLPPHELVVRLRLSTRPAPPPVVREGRRRRAEVGVADAAASASKEDKEEAKDASISSRRERRERQAAVAELREVAAQQQQQGAASSSAARAPPPPPSSNSAGLRRELNDLGEQVRDLARMNAMILEMLEQQKRDERRL
jgi:hypothetical protein